MSQPPRFLHISTFPQAIAFKRTPSRSPHSLPEWRRLKALGVASAERPNRILSCSRVSHVFRLRGDLSFPKDSRRPFVSTICGIHAPRFFSRQGCIRGSFRRCSGMRAHNSRWTPIRTYCLTCSRARWTRWKGCCLRGIVNRACTQAFHLAHISHTNANAAGN